MLNEKAVHSSYGIPQARRQEQLPRSLWGMISGKAGFRPLGQFSSARDSRNTASGHLHMAVPRLQPKWITSGCPTIHPLSGQRFQQDRYLRFPPLTASGLLPLQRGIAGAAPAALERSNRINREACSTQHGGRGHG